MPFLQGIETKFHKSQEAKCNLLQESLTYAYGQHKSHPETHPEVSYLIEISSK